MASSSHFYVAMVPHILSFIFFIFFTTNGASGITITVISNCGFTVCPGISGNPDFNITGFELAQGNLRTFQTPKSWEGQIWGRIGCTFNGSGYGSCTSGDCGSGEIECHGRNYTPPVTIAHFSLSPSWKNYDVSVLKGYNVWMMVEANGGFYDCNKKGCTEDLNRECMSELKLEGEGGCKSPCQDFSSREYCCNISSTESALCKETTYTRLFKSACPRSSVTISDFETNSHQYCDADDYAVTFCPPAGIWYTDDDKSRKVWVANPNKPVITSFADLALSIDLNNGNLVIAGGGTTLMNVTDVQAGPNPNVTATLQDNGNFMLINEIDKRVLWQSFDHPTNVLLPEMKLGSNMTSGQNWTLTSWLSDDILDSGAFTLSWEPIDEANQRLMIRRRGQPYWTSGFLDVKTFEYMFLLDEDRQSKYVISPVYKSKEQYFSLINDPGYKDTKDAFPMWILTPKGQISGYTDSDVWTPESYYGYNSNNGCMESSLPHCRREGVWGIIAGAPVELAVFFGENNNNFMVNSEDDSTLTYVISSQNSINPSTKKNMKQIRTLTGVAITLVFLCLGILLYMRNRKQKPKEYRRRKLRASESFKNVHQLESNN